MGVDALQTVVDALGGSAVEQSGVTAVTAEALRLAEQHSNDCQEAVVTSRDGADECKTAEEIEAVAAARAPVINMAEDRAEAARVLLLDVQEVAGAVQHSTEAAEQAAAKAAADADADARLIDDARLERQEQALESSLEARDLAEVARIMIELSGAARELALQKLKDRKAPVAKLVRDINRMSPVQLGHLRASVQRAAARAEAQALARAREQRQAQASTASGPQGTARTSLVPEDQALYMAWSPAQATDADPKWNAECVLAEKGPIAQGAWTAHANSSRDVIMAAALTALVTSCGGAIEGLKLCMGAPQRIANGLVTFHPAQQAALQAELRGGKHFVTVISGTGTPFTNVAVRLTKVQAPCSAVIVKVQVSGAKTAEVDVLQLASLMRQAGAKVGVQQVQQVLGGSFHKAGPVPVPAVADMHATAMAAIQAAVSYQAGQRLRVNAPAEGPVQDALFEVQMRLDEAEKLPSRIQVVTQQGVAVLLQMAGPGVEACDQCGRRGHEGASCKHGQSRLAPFRIQYWGPNTKGKASARARPAVALTRKARGRGRTRQAAVSSQSSAPKQPQTAAGQSKNPSPAPPSPPSSASAPPSTRADSAEDGVWQKPRSQILKEHKILKKAQAAQQRRQEVAAGARARSLSRLGGGAHRSRSRRQTAAPQGQAAHSPQSRSSRDAGLPVRRNLSPTETDPPIDCAVHMGIGPSHLQHAGAQELEPGEISAAADCTVALNSQGVQQLESC
jgi:hypothetical protein